MRNSRENNTRCRKIILALVAALGLLACNTSDPIRIGFVAGTSGRVADLGAAGRDAVQLAVKQCNQNGGIHGRPIQLLIKDDQQQPDDDFFSEYRPPPASMHQKVPPTTPKPVICGALPQHMIWQTSLQSAILAGREFKGLQESFSFDDYGDVKRSMASISMVKNQRFVVLE